MKKINSKGFSAIEGLLILVIIGLIGFVGWYVLHSKNTANKTYNQAASNTTATKPTVKTNTNSTVDTKDWVAFTSTKFNYSFKHPKDIEVISYDDTPVGAEAPADGFSVSRNGRSTLNFQLSLIFSPTSNDAIESDYAKELFKSGGLKEVTSANRNITIKSDKLNPYTHDNIVGQLTSIKITSGEAWGYKVSKDYSYGFKDDTRSGSLTSTSGKNPTWVVFLSDGSHVHRLILGDSQEEVEMLQTFNFSKLTN